MSVNMISGILMSVYGLGLIALGSWEAYVLNHSSHTNGNDIVFSFIVIKCISNISYGFLIFISGVLLILINKTLSRVKTDDIVYFGLSIFGVILYFCHLNSYDKWPEFQNVLEVETIYFIVSVDLGVLFFVLKNVLSKRKEVIINPSSISNNDIIVDGSAVYIMV